MITFTNHKCRRSLWIVITLLSVLTGSLATLAQPVTWQDLPFPQDSTWPGSQGSPATTNGHEVVLNGQPVRSTQVFTWGSTFTFKTLLDSRPGSSTDDGSFQFNMIPLGQATNLDLTSYTGLFMAWWNFQPDALAIYQSGTQSGSFIPFGIVAQKTNQVTIAVSGTGLLTWTIDGQTYSNGTVTLPFSQFQVQVEGWQPTDTYHMIDFAAVPEPGTLTLAGLGLAVLLAAARRCKSS
jgi:PEP-CTERM motif